jgi:hypothetical protein
MASSSSSNPHSRSKRPKRGDDHKEITGMNTLAFTSQLESLISAGRSNNNNNNTTTNKHPSSRPPRNKKEDIFASHNRNVKKRAAKDLEDDDSAPTATAFEQKHSTSSTAMDTSAWLRSKRKMEEKARLYAAMKRGDVDDTHDSHLVDFDRKWADQQEAKALSDQTDSDDDDDNELSESDKEIVEWQDEFGRTRTGTASQRAREQRLAQLGSESALRSRPAQPTNLIIGDTVQAGAFNPDEPIAQQMAHLASKRDKSLTPPPDTHFDASKEIRRKGVAFMQFSLDNDQERKRQFENLEMERKETERVRGERESRLRERKEEIERRRNAIRLKWVGAGDA